MSSQNQSKIHLAILIIICLLFVGHALLNNYIQDDAYISYRYVENFVEGHGLVFNYGERVEGYTNFLWIMILSLLVKLGLPIILSSKVLGVACGIGTIIISYLLSQDLFDRKSPLLQFIAPVFLAFNGALAYWVTGGLETGLFIFLTSLIIYAELKRPSLTAVLLVVATLTRPEGGLLFGIILIYRVFIAKQYGRELIQYILTYILLLIPYAAFKLLYFGDLLPNPFYAKTGISLAYLFNGLKYAGLFALHYGLFGLIFILPIFYIRSLPRLIKLSWLMSLIYLVYIIWVGGDVLKVHRFFLPILCPLYIILSYSISRLYVYLKYARNNIAFVNALVAVFLVCSVVLPWKYIRDTREMEKALLVKMAGHASLLRTMDDYPFTLAATTIGMISYGLKGCRVIDMLGLTDAEIAKNPEYIEGLDMTWRERNFNSTYILDQRPEYIMFSTGFKPSAPAERALMLHSHFRRNYTPILFASGQSLKAFVWKRFGDFNQPIHVLKNADYANLITDGMNYFSQKNFPAAVGAFQSAVDICDDFSLPHIYLARCYQTGANDTLMIWELNRALKLDSANMYAYSLLLTYYSQHGNYDLAERCKAAMQRLAPWIHADWLR